MARHSIVFVDIDTQADFMMPGGKLYVPGAEQLLPTLARLNEFAAANGIPIVASADAHATDDPEFQQWPPHCVRSTPGQLKVPESLQAHYLVVPRERHASLTEEELSRYRQWILEKNTLDIFTNAHADPLAKSLEAERYLVYGVATEYCVRHAVLGLLRRRQQVALLTDATRAVDAAAGEQALQEMKQAGAALVTGEQLLSRLAHA
jgi:nicotinamidase/pyrazinamidase